LAACSTRKSTSPAGIVVSPNWTGFRPGYPEISPRNQVFAAVKQRQSSSSASVTSMEIHPAIAPQPTDIVVTKRRVSAFSGSDLDVVLRSQDISHLVLCGIATSGSFYPPCGKRLIRIIS